MREVGILLLCVGVVLFRVRGDSDSATMKSLLLGNLLIQFGLLGVELLAFAKGVITILSGILPNSVLHIALATGFAYYYSRCRKNQPQADSPESP